MSGAAARPAGPRRLERLRSRWESLPPRWRVLLSVAAGALAFVLYMDWVWPVAERWSSDGDRIEAILDRAASNEAQLPRSIRDAVESLGPINAPRSEAEGSIALVTLINEVVARHGSVSSFSLDARAGSRLPSASLQEVVGPGLRVERVEGDVQFKASPEDAIAIVRALESSPDIESIRRLRLIRDEANRRIEVTMTVEAWVVGSGPARRGL